MFNQANSGKTCQICTGDKETITFEIPDATKQGKMHITLCRDCSMQVIGLFAGSWGSIQMLMPVPEQKEDIIIEDEGRTLSHIKDTLKDCVIVHDTGGLHYELIQVSYPSDREEGEYKVIDLYGPKTKEFSGYRALERALVYFLHRVAFFRLRKG